MVAYFMAGVMIAFGVGVGMIVAIPPPTSGTSEPPAISYVNLTITVNATNGWPQYSPANITIPTGVVEFTINDTDSAMNWTGCPCPVTGTVGGYQDINATPYKTVPSDNVAHSFSVADWHLAVWSPGMSVVRFKVDVINPGTFIWICAVPCGTGSNPYTTPPMGSPGFMTGKIVVT
jgi:hypothetical protein